MVERIGIVEHWYVGRSLSEMSASPEVKTLRKYIAPAAEAGIAPGGRTKTREECAELVWGRFPELGDARLRQVTWSAIGEHHEFIASQLEARVRVSSLRRYVAANVPEGSGRTQVPVRDHPGAPGADRAVGRRLGMPR